jgi:hypothetical protein
MDIPSGLRREAVEESLKTIAGQIIRDYRAGGRDTLLRYARKAGIGPDEWKGKDNKLFMRLILVYHPDLCAHYLGRIDALRSARDAAGLDRLAAMLVPEPESPRTAGRRAQWRAVEAEPEEYAYAQEDFGYSEGSWSATEDEFHSGDDGYGEDDLDEMESPMDVIEAIKRAYLGNLDAYPSPIELEGLEGELELSDSGIDDLSGAEYLVAVSSLDLSGNAIQNLEPLRRMGALEYLDLSHNLIEDADPLGG